LLLLYRPQFKEMPEKVEKRSVNTHSCMSHISNVIRLSLVALGYLSLVLTLDTVPIKIGGEWKARQVANGRLCPTTLRPVFLSLFLDQSFDAFSDDFYPDGKEMIYDFWLLEEIPEDTADYFKLPEPGIAHRYREEDQTHELTKDQVLKAMWSLERVHFAMERIMPPPHDWQEEKKIKQKVVRSLLVKRLTEQCRSPTLLTPSAVAPTLPKAASSEPPAAVGWVRYSTVSKPQANWEVKVEVGLRAVVWGLRCPEATPTHEEL